MPDSIVGQTLVDHVLADGEAPLGLDASTVRLFDVVRDFVAVAVDDILVYANPYGVELLGGTQGWPIGTALKDIVDPMIWAVVENDFSLLQEETADVALYFRRMDGALADIQVKAVACRYDGRPGTLIYAKDMSKRRRDIELILRTERRFQRLFDLALDFTAICRGTTFQYINPAGVALLGAAATNEIVGRRFDDFVHPDYVDLVTQGLAVFADEADPVPLKLTTLQGRHFDIELAVSALPDEADAYVLEIHDVDLIKRASQQVLDREMRLSSIMDAVADAILTIDGHGLVRSANRAAERLLAAEAGGLVGQAITDIVTCLPGDRIVDIARRYRAAAAGDDKPDAQVRRCDGSSFPADITTSNVMFGQEKIFVLALHDLTKRRAAEARVRQLAFHDALTGLPNRATFTDRLQQAIALALRNLGGVAVLYVDLDDFKAVNDSFGHPQGDRLLVAVAERMVGALRASDTVSRFGGDEFVILLHNVTRRPQATRVAQKIIAALATPFALDGHEFRVACSIGITMFPEHGHDVEELLRHADAAMYAAKRGGRGRYCFFTADMHSAVIKRLSLVQDLRAAFERDQFTIFLQPKVTLATGALSGGEVLVRWRHPERGMVPPGEFIAACEESGLIVPLGAWILRQACATIAGWRRADLPTPPLAVNVSGLQFGEPGFVAMVGEMIAEHGISPADLELELTESILIGNAEVAIATLGELRRMGVAVSIDDFGTGYSSLSYLKRFPVDALKIDMSFVRNLPVDPADATIVAAIINIAHSLSLSTVAEGVETAAHRDILARMGCQYAQGYLYDRPLPVEDFTARWLAPGR